MDSTDNVGDLNCVTEQIPKSNIECLDDKISGNCLQPGEIFLVPLLPLSSRMNRIGMLGFLFNNIQRRVKNGEKDNP
jgi:hypothetical protein